jgi:filamentous hemagglutinin family protein
MPVNGKLSLSDRTGAREGGMKRRSQTLVDSLLDGCSLKGKFSSREKLGESECRRLYLVSLIVGFSALFLSPAQAQIVPDDTLGGERSVVEENFQGTPNDVIRGGARRGVNLFHSFREFGVGEGRGAYFLTPDADIRNIFARITGANRSEILGILGTRQDGSLDFTSANLFLMNPNGILFGRNSRLDLGGSFVGTTADAIGFSDRGVFSAVGLEAPSQVLVVNPSAFLFSQDTAGNIIHRANISSPLNPNVLGFLVPNQRNLLLLGGDVILDGGSVTGVGGQIELGGLAAPGTVELQTNGNSLNLNFSTNATLANVTLNNDAQVLLSGGNSGSIRVNANVLNANAGGRIVTVTTGTEQGGNVTVNANAVNLAGIGQSGRQSSLFSSASVNTTGNGGNITVNTQSLKLQDGALIIGVGNSTGDTGAIAVNTDSLSIFDNALIQTVALGRGNSSDIQVNARGDVDIDAGEVNSLTGILTTATNTAGRSGNINITAGSLSLESPGGQITSSTLGQAGSGDISINTRDRVALNNRASINSYLLQNASGRIGNISITTGSLRLTNNAAVATSIAGQGVNDRGSGEISVDVRDTVLIDSSSIASGALQGGGGRAGSIRMSTGDLILLDSGFISATTSGNGDAGDIRIDARGAVSLDNKSSIGSAAFLLTVPDGSRSNVQTVRPDISARSGTIVIRANSLSLAQESVINTELYGSGQAGDIDLDISGDVQLLDGSVIGSGTFGFDEQFRAQGFDETLRSIGDAGDITLAANSVTLRDGSQINSGIGDGSEGIGGNVTIAVRDVLSIDGTPNLEGVGAGILTRLDPGATGRGGNININAGSVILTNGAQLSANTRGQGDAGSVSIRASRNLSLSDRSEILSNVDTNAVGRGGDIIITANAVMLSNRASLIANTFGQGNAGNTAITVRDRLSLTEESTILSTTEGQGDAGNITIQADGDISITSRSGISSGVNANATGRGGNLRIEAGSLTLRNGGQLQTSTNGIGRAGNIVIDVEEAVRLSRLVTRSENGRDIPSVSQIRSSVERGGQGRAGRIRLRAGSLSMDDLSNLSSSTDGRGNAGNLRLRVSNMIHLDDLSSIRSEVGAGGIGNAGDINIRARSLTLTNGGEIIATVTRPGSNILGGQGQGGNLRLNITDFINIDGYSSTQRSVVDQTNPAVTFITTGFSSGLFTNSERGASGNAGNIFVTTDDVRVTNGGIVIASTANPDSNSGNIRINARNFEARGGGQVVTATQSEGQAGRITLNIAENTILAGFDPKFQQRRAQVRQVLSEPGQTDRLSDVVSSQGAASGLFANTSGRSGGNGGSIQLNTENLVLSDRARISAQSQGRGNAGSITLDVTNRFHLNNSDIVTAATNSAGGNIRINNANSAENGIVILENSDITTNSRSDGGNINIQGAGLLAFDDSDILARSTSASGGEINLGTFFSETSEPFEPRTNADGNGQVDINAQGRQASGNITTTDTSFIQNSLADIPEAPLDTDRLLTNSCLNRTPQTGRFTRTGTDGLPQRPGNANQSDYSTGTVQSIPEAESRSNRPWRMGDAIVEPQGVHRLPDGRLAMGSNCDAPE